MPFNSFSAHRIKRPRTGVWSMHPFVDVLEDRSFMCAAVHDGVLSVQAVGGGMDLVTADSTGPAFDDRTTDLHNGRTGGPHPMGHAGAQLHPEPARVELKTAGGQSAFSATPIGEGNDVLFGNLPHDRRSRAAPRALPAPVKPGGQPTTGRAEGPFRDGRPLIGAMRPYLTMTVPVKAGAFAA